jgi:RNA polymerase sigma-70 factor (ECF subfamily)
VDQQDLRQRFEQQMLPHLDAAWNLARWLMRNDQDARDVVQEAYLRAWRFFGSFHGAQTRPWLLAIVRNAAFSWMAANRKDTRPLDPHGADDPLDEASPEALAEAGDERARVNRAIAALPPEFREVVVLRELEDMSYRDIAQVTAIPVGTVMSRLSRARKLLGVYLSGDTMENRR